MFGLFEKEVAPIIGRLGVERAEECSSLHALSFSYPWPETDFEALLVAPTTYAEGAYGRGDEFHGFILSRLAADEAEVLTIAVQPKKRGLGIAGKLMRANMERLQIAGARSWFLEVEANNAPALALYRQLGFAPVGERTSYYRTPDGAPSHALILKRELR